jgi:hypothetical protein
MWSSLSCLFIAKAHYSIGTYDAMQSWVMMLQECPGSSSWNLSILAHSGILSKANCILELLRKYYAVPVEFLTISHKQSKEQSTE